MIDDHKIVVIMAQSATFERLPQNFGLKGHKSMRKMARGGALARRARAGHLFFTIPHPCLF